MLMGRCDAKLRRMDYEKQLVDLTDSEEENGNDDQDSCQGDQRELLDVKCINVLFDLSIHRRTVSPAISMIFLIRKPFLCTNLLTFR